MKKWAISGFLWLAACAVSNDDVEVSAPVDAGQSASPATREPADDAAAQSMTPNSPSTPSTPATPMGQTRDAGVDAATANTFPMGQGVTTPVDRSTPCAASEVGMFRNAPEEHETIQACLPNYQMWAVVACGGPRPPCACDASHCASGEVAKLVSGMFCVCMSACSMQAEGAKCGPNMSRKCIPVDDVTKKQVFVCGGTGS